MQRELPGRDFCVFISKQNCLSRSNCLKNIRQYVQIGFIERKTKNSCKNDLTIMLSRGIVQVTKEMKNKFLISETSPEREAPRKDFGGG